MSATNVFTTWAEIQLEVSYKWDQDSLLLVSATVNESPTGVDILSALSKEHREALRVDATKDWVRKQKEAWDK